MQQILWVEIVLKAAIGAALITVPLTVVSLAGLQRPETGFWPRLLGALVLAVATSIWIGIRFPEARGAIGPAGLTAAMLAPLVLGKAAPTRRGRLLIAVGAALLLGPVFVEIAHV